MPTGNEFTLMWEQAAKDMALLPNSRKSYWSWTRMFYRFVKSSAAGWSGSDWKAFERILLDKGYSNSARRQARCALNFIFRHALKKDVGGLDLPVIPRVEHALVVVPTRQELAMLFAGLSGQELLACRIMHGSGTRVEETCRIRVQDVDLENARLRVWDGKGAKNRITVLPRSLVPNLERQIKWRRALHERDLVDGFGFVELPNRLANKMRGAQRELGWQWLLASSEVKRQHRWYLSPDCVSRALLKARRSAGIVKRVTCHSLRKAFASEAQQLGMDVRTIQACLGHADLVTTATYYLAINMAGAFSPADVPTTGMIESPRRVYQLTNAH